MAAASSIRDCLMQPIPIKPGPMANVQGNNVGASESKIIFKTIFIKQILFFLAKNYLFFFIISSSSSPTPDCIVGKKWEPRNPVPALDF